MSEAIESMPAGRKLDAEVAKALGWTDVEADGPDFIGTPPNGHRYSRTGHIPPYSTDIATAWLVVEHIRKAGWQLRLFTCDVGFAATFALHELPGSSRREVRRQAANASAPLAICLAALRAIGGVA